MQVCIAVPVYKQEHPMHRAAQAATLAHFGKRAVVYRQRWDSCLARARATLLGAVLHGGGEWTHLLQTDDDQSWDPRHLELLMELDLPVVGLPCALKFSPPHPAAGRSTVRFLPGQTPAADGTVRVRYLGGGWILWRRDVLEELCVRHPELGCDTNIAGVPSEATWWLWGGGVVDREPLTEDYWACHLAAQAGYEIRCYVRACSPHWTGDRDDPRNEGGTWRAYVPTGFSDPMAGAARAPASEAA